MGDGAKPEKSDLQPTSRGEIRREEAGVLHGGAACHLLRGQPVQSRAAAASLDPTVSCCPIPPTLRGYMRVCHVPRCQWGNRSQGHKHTAVAAAGIQRKAPATQLTTGFPEAGLLIERSWAVCDPRGEPNPQPQELSQGARRGGQHADPIVPTLPGPWCSSQAVTFPGEDAKSQLAVKGQWVQALAASQSQELVGTEA
ncbi:unnamed protein product [Lepidochelys kempii]